MSQKTVVWITKYALTSGIDKVVATVLDTGMVTYGNIGWRHQYAHGKDWHRTPESAIARAEEMRTAKIASLKKSIAKLEKMVFTAPEVGP